MGFKRLRIICLPYRNSVYRIGTKLTASSISERREDTDLQYQGLRLDLLLERLKSANLIDNASPFNLTYKAEESQMMGIKTDHDLQLAVNWHCRHGANFMQVNMMTPDDWGQ